MLYGFRVLSTTGSLRLDNDSDIAMARVLVAMANKSSADTARRVARASKPQALDGKWHGDRAPYGYRMGELRRLPVNEAARRIEAKRAEQENTRPRKAERTKQLRDPFERDPHRRDPRRDGPTRSL